MPLMIGERDLECLATLHELLTSSLQLLFGVLTFLGNFFGALDGVLDHILVCAIDGQPDARHGRLFEESPQRLHAQKNESRAKV